MPNIRVSVKNKIARKTGRTEYICGNSDFVVVFSFDEEWDEYDTKTARFRYGSAYTDIVFSGDACEVPVINDAGGVEIGVFAGDLHTTTPAYVPCRRSILSGGGAPADPPASVYNQIMARLNIGGTGSGGTDTVTVPDYWEEELSAAIARAKALQDQGGADVITFLWFSDMHVQSAGYGTASFTDLAHNIGRLAGRAMQELSSPLCLNGGDLLSAWYGQTKAQVLDSYDKAWVDMTGIPAESLAVVKGNHDAVYGSRTTDSGTTYYTKAVPPNELWQKLFRPVAADLRRVFGSDGSYYYLDNIPQKFRLICLNSQWVEYNTDSQGDVLCSSMSDGGFGQAQLSWLSECLQSVPEGYTVAVALHCPPTDNILDTADGTANAWYYKPRDVAILRAMLTAYGNKETMAAQSYTHNSALGEDEWADVSLPETSFAASGGTLCAVFAGHVHRDRVVTGELPCPILTITGAAGCYDADNEGTRTYESATETALDIVSIDKSRCMIYTTRIGIGADRSVSYAQDEGSTPVTGYTNRLPLAIDSDGSVLGGVGYLNDKRLNSSGAVADLYSANAGWGVSGFIPATATSRIRVRNVKIDPNSANAGTIRWCAYDASFAFLGELSYNNLTASASSGECEFDASGCVTAFYMVSNSYDLSQTAYIRIMSETHFTAASIVTVDEEIV